jgi:outer membrane receptor for ferrienterochelin and colicins
VNLNGRFTSDLGTSDHLFTFGLDSFVETLDSTRLATGSAVRVRAGLYAQDEWTLLDDLAWRLTPGVRLDLDSDYGAILTPRLATAITPIEALTLRFSAGLGFRGPGFRELHFAFDNAAVGYTVAGNPDLRPEHGLSLQTGATVSILPEALSLRAELFMHRLRDLITTAPITTPGAAGDRFTYINIGRAISQGAEFALEMKGPCGLAASLGYSLIDARDAATDLRLPGRALHNAELELHWRPRELPVSAMLRASFIGERIHEIATPGGLERRSFDADLLLDARIAWQLDAHVEVFAVADNLLDAGHPDALPIAPRSVRAGLRSRFD